MRKIFIVLIALVFYSTSVVAVEKFKFKYNLHENLPRMHGGWEEVWPEGKKKLRSAKKFIPVDKKEKKAMMKKAKGHNMLYRECFDSYYPQILDFIASKVK